MRLLSIHSGHNATVALMEDGRILGILSQEKIDNRKNSAGFPRDAILALCAELGWDLQSIDEIVLAGITVYPKEAYEYLFDSKNRIPDRSAVDAFFKRLSKGAAAKVFPAPFRAAKRLRHKRLCERGESYLRDELAEIGLSEKPLSRVEHHLCHARAAFHSFARPGDGEPALVFTLDGSGDGLCATVTRVGEDGSWERLAATPVYASLGNIYSVTTRFLGMKILEHEYKVMGLAPYAKTYFRDTYERIFKPVVWLSPENPMVFKSAFDTGSFYEYLVKEAVGERFDNLAGALQFLTEEMVVAWIRAAVEKTGIRRIFTGGGVFMNVKVNKRIQEMPEIDRAYFMPSCGDESNPIGAAYDVAVARGLTTTPLENVYQGVSFSEATLRQFIERNGLNERYVVSRPENIEETVAGMLAAREVVARFAGRCEWGARSLGNRAILAHPSYMESFYTVNDLIKSRDFWMPFAPSVLDSAAPRYLEGYNPQKVEAPYMITAFKATPLGRRDLRAAMHQGDFSLRPQVLKREANPDYYRLLQAFEQQTGIGAVLNTSLNLHGYPLVATPEQAVFTLENSGLKHLALGPFLLSKREGQMK